MGRLEADQGNAGAEETGRLSERRRAAWPVTRRGRVALRVTIVSPKSEVVSGEH